MSQGSAAPGSVAERNDRAEYGALASAGLWIVSACAYQMVGGFAFDKFLAIALLSLSSVFCLGAALLGHRAHPKPLPQKTLVFFTGLEFAKTILLLTTTYFEHTSGGFDAPWPTSLATMAILACLGIVLAIAIVGGRQIGSELARPFLPTESSRNKVERIFPPDVFIPLTSMGTLFLCATYFMTFALVAHDSSELGGALRLGPNSEPRSEVSELPEGTRRKCLSRFEGVSIAIRFPMNSASMFGSESLLLEADEFDLLWGKENRATQEVKNGSRANFEAIRAFRCVLGEVGSRPLTIPLVSNGSLAQLKNQSVENPPRGSENPQIVTRSESEEAPFALSTAPSQEHGYGSGYELAQARIVSVQDLLERAGVPQGSRPSWKPQPSGEHPSVGDSVEIRFELTTAHHLSLLDHLYFMVYTITTTGYGDLAPRTPLAKFLTTLANLFEIYFLVIALNVVIGIVIARKGHNGCKAKDEVDG